MTTQVANTIGTSSRDYSTHALWAAAIAINMTTTRSAMTVAGSTASTIVLDALASASNNFYNGLVVSCDARPTEKRLITAYNGTTKIATIGALNGSSATWANTPGTEAFTIDAVSSLGNSYNDSEFTAGVAISGNTTSSTSTITLTAAAGQSYVDNAGVQTTAHKYDQSLGVGIKANGDSTNALVRSAVNNTIITRIQVKNTVSTYSSAGLSIIGSGSYCNQVIIEGLGRHGYAGAGALTIINSAKAYNFTVIQSRSEASVLVAIDANCSLFSGTIVCPTGLTPAGIGVDSYYAGNIGKNLNVFGVTADTAGSGTWTTCFTDDTSPSTGFTGSLTYANQFVNVTNASKDFRPKAGGNILNVGTDTHVAEPLTATDIVGTVRPQSTGYDGGSWELVVASGAVVPKLSVMGVG